MMNLFVPLILLFIVQSCSTSKIERKIDDAAWDSLADESYLRWGEGRLKNQKDSDHLVMNCYQGKAQETLDAYKKDLLIKGKSLFYWIHVGNCYFMKGNLSKAEFYYRMSLDESKSPSAKSISLNNLGLISLKYEQWEKGREYLKQSMDLAPNFKVPRFNLSQLYLQFGFFDEAIQILDGSAFKGHKDVDVYFSLANAWLYKGDLKKSSDFFKLIPSNYFRREDIAATYALFLIKTGKMIEAKKIMGERDRSGTPELSAITQKIETILRQKMDEE